MEQTIQLAGLSGSLRKGSFNTMLLHATQALLPAGVSMRILSIAELPLYNADLDMPAAESRPESVELFINSLKDVQGLVIASPEYNYSIPGGLKNALDWASRGANSPLLKKPVLLMGATPGMWGTVRMQLAFQPLFSYLDMKPVYKPEILLANAQQKFDAEGKLIDQKTKELIAQKIDNLCKLIRSGNY